MLEVLREKIAQVRFVRKSEVMIITQVAAVTKKEGGIEHKMT